MNKQTERLSISGMSCSHCVRAVTSALDEVEGVEVKHVEIGAAEVAYDPERVRRTQLVEAVEEAGFSVATGA